MSRRIDVALAALASAIGLIGLGFAIFGPATISYGTNWLEAGSRSLWDAGIGSAGVLLYLALMALAAVGVGIGTYLRARGGGALALTLMWSSALVLLVGAFMTLPGQNAAVVPTELHTDTPDSVGIGIYLIPAAGFALLTALVETISRHVPASAGPLGPREHA